MMQSQSCASPIKTICIDIEKNVAHMATLPFKTGQRGVVERRSKKVAMVKPSHSARFNVN